ncbi:MAG: hypothetical protein KTR29_04180 [Rhodothermaceae bacterium]|nr:hypothetical protein [Rhodothermaceae bacterium]
MSEQSLQIIESIKKRLKRTAQRRYLTHIVFGAVILLGVLAGLWLFSTALEAGFWLASTVRIVLTGTTLLLGLGVLVWFVILPLLRFSGVLSGASEAKLAKDIGSYFPQVADRLLNLLHLAEGKRSSASNEFVNHAVMSLGKEIESVEFEKMESFDRAVNASKFAAIPLLGLIVFLVAAPNSFMGASQRLLTPGAEFDRPALFQMQVSPGSVELLRGDSLRISIALTGEELPTSLTLLYKDKLEDKIVEESLYPDSSGAYARTFVNVRRSFNYSLQANPVTTPWYDVDIVERPIIRSIQVSLESPAYSRIPQQRLEPNVGDIQALPGTRVNLDALIGGPDITEAYVEFDNGVRDTLEVRPGGASGSFALTREGTYHLVVKDANDTENSNPIRYSMKLLQDGYPTAVLLSPEPLSELNETLSTTLASRITDDFGFNRLRLYYRLAESRFGEPMPNFESITLQINDRSSLDQDILFDWDLGETPLLDPVPGDAIEYYIQVWDNDSYSGFKSSKSQTQLLRLPSLAEQYKDLEQREDDVQDEMEELLKDTRDIDEQFKELQDELRNKLESDWEDQRQLEQIKEKQSELESKVESLNESFEEMTQQMENNNLSSDETQQLYEEMQQVLEEINSPELMDALNQLQEAMQELNLQQMQESLNNFQINEDQYQNRLERSLELFKQIRVQQDLDEVARRAEELAEQQERMQEETAEAADEDNNQQEDGEQQDGEQQDGEQQDGEQQDGEQQDGEQQDGEQQDGEQQDGEQQDGDQHDGDQQDGEQQSSKEQLAQQQELSKEEMEAIEQKMKEIQERMEELENAPSEQMEQLNEQVQDQQIPEQMQENADQLRQEQFDQAQQQQQQMQQQLQQMQQQMQQMQQGMQGAQMQINIAGLRRALSDILTLSQLQEGLRENVRGLATDSPTMRQLAQDQVELSSGLRVVSDSLQSLSQKIPQMSREVQQHAGDAMREMSSAVESMTDRVANRASGHQKEAMMHLNELALLLSDLLNEMMNQQGSGGGGMSMQQMIQQLQNAAGQQQKLNQQIQQMLNESQGNRLSQDMQQRLRQMASQQEQIRSQIKQLSRNRELKRELMGDLNRIAEQMEETIRELQRSRPGRRTVERQQEILTRMLEATKSMQERGREKRREGQLGEEFFRESPDELSPSEESDRLRRALIEALESGYAPDYEELIKKYFELLQEKSSDTP